MKKLIVLSLVVLPLLASCNLMEVVGEFGDGTAYSEMYTTTAKTSEYVYENYTQHLYNTPTSNDTERQNMLNDAARRAR